MARAGFSVWRPTDASRAMLEMIDAVFVEYEDYLPLTGRQIFYRLVGAFGYEKSDDAANRVYNVLNRARRAGIVPFHTVRDGGGSKALPLVWDDADAFWTDVRDRFDHFSRNRQAGQPAFVELFCEAPGMMPQLQRVAFPYSVPVYGTRGFTGLGVVAEIARRALVRVGPTVILQVGDYDPSGVMIFDTLAADVRAFVSQVVSTLDTPNDDGDGDGYVGALLADRLGLTEGEVSDLMLLDADQRPSVEMRRVALTWEQVEEHGLETAPVSKTRTGGENPHAASWVGEVAQLEAMPPDLLADTVRAAIDAEFDLDRYWEEIDSETADKASIEERLPD